MQIPVDLVIFDFDGTLVDTGEDIALSVRHTLEQLNLPILEKAEILTFIGDGVIRLIELATTGQDQALREKALAIFSEHYDRHMMDHASLDPGVVEVLRHFAQKRKVILTNKRLRFTEKMAAALQIGDFFNEIIGADSTPFMKPDPRLVSNLLLRHPADRARTIMIGDGINDILLARNAGILSAGYLRGLGSREEILALGPDMVFEDFGELHQKMI